MQLCGKKAAALAAAAVMLTVLSPVVHAEKSSLLPAEKPGWNLVFQEEFNDAVLDAGKFSDSYLPHWTTYKQSLAHYDVTDGILSLRIDKDTQGPWWAHGGRKRYPASKQACEMACTSFGTPAPCWIITAR